MTTLMTTLRCCSGFVWFRCEGYTRNLRSDGVGKHGRGVLRRGLLGDAWTPRRPNDANKWGPTPCTPCGQCSRTLARRAPAPGPACTSGSSRPCAWRQRNRSGLVSKCDKKWLETLAWDRLQTSTTLVCCQTRVTSSARAVSKERRHPVFAIFVGVARKVVVSVANCSRLNVRWFRQPLFTGSRMRSV